MDLSSFLLTMLAVIVANQLDKRWSIGDKLVSQIRPAFRKLATFSKPFLKVYKTHRWWALFYMLLATGVVFIFLWALIPVEDGTLQAIIALTLGFYFSGWFFISNDKQVRRQKRLDAVARKEAVKARRRFYRQQRALINKQEAEDFWSIHPLRQLLRSWNNPRDIFFIIFLRLTKYYPFSLFGLTRGGHYRHRHIHAMCMQLELEARKQGLPSDIKKVIEEDQFYLLQFTLEPNIKKKVTDQFLRVIEQKNNLNPQSLFLRMHDDEQGSEKMFEVIIPKEAAGEIG